MSIQVRHLNKRFGQTVACDNLDLDIPAGDLLALLRPSGCVKTDGTRRSADGLLTLLSNGRSMARTSRYRNSSALKAWL